MGEFKGRIEPFAKRLRRAMDMMGVNNAELSRQTGVSEQSIGQYVRGRYEAKQTAVYVIANALRVSPAWLAGYDVSMEPPVEKRGKKSGRPISNEELKLALFDTKEVSDDLLEDVLDMAKIHLELWRKKRAAPKKGRGSKPDG